MTAYSTNSSSSSPVKPKIRITTPSTCSARSTASGKILALTILYEIHDISRFPRVQQFVSYCRLVKCSRQSAGKNYGFSGKKIGNVHLKWAFSEAAVLFLCNNPEGQKLLARLERKHGKAKALTILAHKLARAVYFILRTEKAFDLTQFLAA